MSIKRVPVSELRLGMYVHKIGGHWFKHSFWRSAFMLEQQSELDSLLGSDIQFVWVDLQKSRLPVPETGETTSTWAECGENRPFGHMPETGRNTSTWPGPDDSWPEPSDHDTDANALLARTTAHHDRAPDNETGRLAPDHETSPRIPIAEELERAREICLEAEEKVLDMFSQARMGKVADPDRVLGLVEEIAHSVERHPQALISVARLKTSDSYTYLHSVAVSALMIALARQLGLDDEMVQIAGLGGLMHDLGKAAIPLEILNKPGRLSDEEFEIIKQHPFFGARMLQESKADPNVQDIALYHHEKYDGSGYPEKLAGESIPLLARMGAICDVYDAVTSDRPYNKGWNPAETMRRMAGWHGHFDNHLFEAFVKSVGIYPIGSLVRLKSGHLALVSDAGPSSLLYPEVIVFYSLIKGAHIPPERLRLYGRTCTDVITGPADPAAWGFQDLDHLWQNPVLQQPACG